LSHFKASSIFNLISFHSDLNLTMMLSCNVDLSIFLDISISQAKKLIISLIIKMHLTWFWLHPFEVIWFLLIPHRPMTKSDDLSFEHKMAGEYNVLPICSSINMKCARTRKTSKQNKNITNLKSWFFANFLSHFNISIWFFKLSLFASFDPKYSK